MSRQRFGSKNMREHVVGSTKVMYSYTTPVVIFDGEHYFVTTEHFSSTTTKQINFYLRDEQASSVSRLDPDLFRKLGRKLNLF